MKAPDRSAAVARIFADHPPAHWTGTFPDDEVRRVYLLETVIPELNKIDPQWGALVKNDRTPPFVPSDIIVWRDTREHWDVLTDTGPAWQADGPIQAAWDWLAVSSVGVVVPPVEPPPVENAHTLAKLEGIVAELELTVDANHQRMEAINTRFDNDLRHVDARLKTVEARPPAPEPPPVVKKPSWWPF